MSRFLTCLQFVLEREGGYRDLPEDRGGPTNKGITQRVYDEYRQDSGLPLQPVRFIPPDEVADIYRTRYWNACNCGLLPDGLDLVVFDGAVNHGVRQSSKFLQRALGVAADGVIGPMTIAQAQKDEDAGLIPHVCEDILQQRSQFYDELVKRDPQQIKFRKGWGNRLAELKHATEVA